MAQPGHRRAHWSTLSIRLTPPRPTETSRRLPSKSSTARRRPGEIIIVSLTAISRLVGLPGMRVSIRRHRYRQPIIRPHTSGSRTTSFRI
ncbi:hypothetical protein WR25_01408 [Diploscapter pachys]|uniref:Uncharacterized protein n=1 Tax=Diploscapter pachys TaxID=2018661 RepID=A0A2A2M4D1_9BILA|nr:hypothetical protein WR25_01408 [Diploscapter pachys]